MLESEMLTLRDFVPLALTIVITAIVPMLPIPRRFYVVSFLAALAGVVVPVALTVVGFNHTLEDLSLTTRYVVLFWAPVFVAPALVASAEAVQARRISWRGIVASTAFVSIFATDLLSHFMRRGFPLAGPIGAMCVVGWVLAPAAIVAITYAVGSRDIWKYCPDAKRDLPR
jgi:hypothetical protein